MGPDPSLLHYVGERDSGGGGLVQLRNSGEKSSHTVRGHVIDPNPADHYNPNPQTIGFRLIQNTTAGTVQEQHFDLQPMVYGRRKPYIEIGV